MGYRSTTAERFMGDLMAGKVPVRIGLRAQGHLPTIGKMLEKGATWDEIGEEIGWDGNTAKDWYRYEQEPTLPNH